MNYRERNLWDQIKEIILNNINNIVINTVNQTKVTPANSNNINPSVQNQIYSSNPFGFSKFSFSDNGWGNSKK